MRGAAVREGGGPQHCRVRHNARQTSLQLAKLIPPDPILLLSKLPAFSNQTWWSNIPTTTSHDLNTNCVLSRNARSLNLPSDVSRHNNPHKTELVRLRGGREWLQVLPLLRELLLHGLRHGEVLQGARVRHHPRGDGRCRLQGAGPT